MRRLTVIGLAFLLVVPPVSAQAADDFTAPGSVIGVVAALLALSALAIYVNLNRRVQTLTRQQEEAEAERTALRQQVQAAAQQAAAIPDEKPQDDARVQAALEEVQRLIEQQRRESVNSILSLSLLALGQEQYQGKDLRGALETYRRALALSPHNPIIHYRLAYIHTQRGELERAEGYLKQGLNVDPEFAPALAAMGYVYRRKAEKDPRGQLRDRRLFDAESRLLSALYSAPRLLNEDGESWWCTLGGLYRDRGQFKKATDAYRKAAQVTPYSSYPVIHLALYAGMEEDHETMMQYFREAERLARQQTIIAPAGYWPYADLLVARLALGKIQEAEDTLNNVVKLLPPDMVYAGPQLIWTLGRLETLMPEGTANVREAIEHLHAHLRVGREVIKDVSLANQSFTIPFAGRLPALGVRVSIQDDLATVAHTLDLAEARPTIFILGGAVDMAAEEMQATRQVIEEGLIPYVQQHSLAVIDGGTHSGVMQLMGEARAKHSATFPLIGVAPVNLVKYKGHENEEGYALDPGHSHFILTSEGEWGDETDTIAQFAYTLSGQGKYAGLGLVINGGAIVRQEVYRLTITERLKFPMLVLEGSGRFADTLAEAYRSGHTDDDELREVITKGAIELVAVKDGPQALQRKLDEYLRPG